MTRVFIRDLRDRIGEEVMIFGWIHTLRRQRRMQFVLIRDPTGVVQAVHGRGGPSDELERRLDSLTTESAVKVTGTVVENPAVKLGGRDA